MPTVAIYRMLKNVVSRFRFRGLGVILERGSSLSHCEVGRFVRICSNSVLYQVQIGDMSYVGAHSAISRTAIGRFTSIGPHVLIGLGSHPVGSFVSTHPAFYSPHRRAAKSFCSASSFTEHESIRIGGDVWIGARSTILDGVTISDGAIIAAGSVVTLDVPPYAIFGGVPAKLIRYRYDPDMIQKLLCTKWWLWDIDRVERFSKEFLDVEEFVSHATQDKFFTD